MKYFTVLSWNILSHHLSWMSLQLILTFIKLFKLSVVMVKSSELYRNRIKKNRKFLQRYFYREKFSSEIKSFSKEIFIQELE